MTSSDKQKELEALTDTEIAEIEARAKAATPGPWKWRNGHLERCDGRFVPDNLDNAAFLTFARTDIPRLLATLAARDETIEAMRKEKDAATKLANLAKALLDDANTEARDLREALASVIDDTCSYICPSTGTAGVPIPHSERCMKARELLSEPS